ncbi:MAG: tetratricopeptide repeat protein [Persicimonas sp.]
MSIFSNRVSVFAKPGRWASWLVVVLCLGVGFEASAQEEEEKEEAAIEVEKATDQKEAPTLKDEEEEAGEQANLQADEFIEDKSFKDVKLADEQIVRLKDLLDSTPQDNPKRAEYMFNLSEMYWDKSKSHELEAFDKQDECYALEDQGKKKAVKRCEMLMDQNLAESERLREKSVDLYKQIARNYPEFEELDKVLFFLGTNLQQIGDQEDAMRVFRTLLGNYPNTEYKPNVLLSFGEYYFNNDQVEEAYDAYQKAAQFEDSSVYAYARYKAAWCLYNMDQKDRALDTFLEVIEHARNNPDNPNSGALIRQAQKDIVRTYAHIGNPKGAIPFLKDLAGDEKKDWLGMAERLAIHYGDQGNTPDSTRMYKQLIAENKTSVKTIDYQYEIVRNQTVANAYSKQSIQELIRMMKLVQLADDDHFEDAEEHDYPRIRKRVESLVRQWSTQYHREAQKTKNADLYSMAYFLYKHYHATFDDSPKKYDMSFFYGELLYKLQQWEQAAEAYERVLSIDPEGKYTEESVHAAVLAYFKVVDVSEAKANLDDSKTAKSDDDTDDGEEEGEEGEEQAKGPPEPKEIPDIHKKLINACERYMKHAPDGGRIVDVKYTMARTYYDFNHFREALDLFKDIAYNHSNHRLSIIAANLHLDTLNLLEDFDGLHEAVVGYIEERPLDDGPFMEDVNKLNVQIRFKKCTIHDENEDWKDAAKCFVQFYRDFPDEDEYVDKALYNAALDFERMKDLGKAITVRKFLLQAAPESDLAPETLFNIGGNYHALAVYSEAAKFYELFVRNFPDHEDSEPALANASEFRYGLGHYDRAIKDYEKYLELYGKSKPERAAISYFQIARIHEKRGEDKDGLEQYESFLRRFGDKSDHDRILKAQTAIGMYYWELGGESNRKRALDEFDETLAIYDSLDEETQKGLTEGADAAARAKFMKGEDIFEEMAAITIESSDEEDLKERIKEKMKVAEKAQKIFEEVLTFKRPDWAIAALYRIGSQYQDFAETVRDSPVPDRLTEDQTEIYKGLLEDRASSIEIKAVDAYEKALEIALKRNWFNKYSKRAEIELAQLRPKDYRRPSELRAEPEHFNPGFMRSAFITNVKEEDRLQDLDEGAGEDSTEESMDDPDVSEKDGEDQEAPAS